MMSSADSAMVKVYQDGQPKLALMLPLCDKYFKSEVSKVRVAFMCQEITAVAFKAQVVVIAHVIM